MSFGKYTYFYNKFALTNLRGGIFLAFFFGCAKQNGDNEMAKYDIQKYMHLVMRRRTKRD